MGHHSLRKFWYLSPKNCLTLMWCCKLSCTHCSGQRPEPWVQWSNMMSQHCLTSFCKQTLKVSRCLGTPYLLVCGWCSALVASPCWSWWCSLFLWVSQPLGLSFYARTFYFTQDFFLFIGLEGVGCGCLSLSYAPVPCSFSQLPNTLLLAHNNIMSHEFSIIISPLPPVHSFWCKTLYEN